VHRHFTFELRRDADGEHLALESPGGTMPNRPQRETTPSTDHIPPDRHHGGQELPDDVQDRPEQNAGYDAAVRGEDMEDPDLTDLDRVLEDIDRDNAADEDADDITH
jgi:hypothetical protein